MSENKCPFCGEAMITTEDKIMLCENSDCATMFNEWDYPKVAAAMELAKAEIAARKSSTMRANILARDARVNASCRVLEVFK